MSKLLLLSVIGLLGLGALPGRAADGEPGAGHVLAQARKSDVTRQLEPGLSNNSRLENDTPVDSSQALSAAQRSSLTAVRFLTTHTYTRVMMELSQEVRYEIHRLKEDPSKGLPPRI